MVETPDDPARRGRQIFSQLRAAAADTEGADGAGVEGEGTDPGDADGGAGSSSSASSAVLAEPAGTEASDPRPPSTSAPDVSTETDLVVLHHHGADVDSDETPPAANDEALVAKGDEAPAAAGDERLVPIGDGTSAVGSAEGPDGSDASTATNVTGTAGSEEASGAADDAPQAADGAGARDIQAAIAGVEPSVGVAGDGVLPKEVSGTDPAGTLTALERDVAVATAAAGVVAPQIAVDAAPAPGSLRPPPPPDLEQFSEATAEVVTAADDMAPPVPAADRFARPLPRILAIANQKGGVGKTTTAVNLGACLADLGYRVLVCDLDPQGNASTGLGLNPHNIETSMYDVILNDLPIEDCIEPSTVRNLFVAPASLDLAGAEIELVPAFSRELRLKRALEAVHDDFDFVLIDCPPSLGLLTVNGLAAASEVVVPVQCEYYALEGLGQLLRNVDLVQRNLNTALEVSAIICVMYDARTKLSEQVVQEVRRHFGDRVCRNVVPRTVRLSEAPSFGQPIIAFDPTSRGAIAYRELAKEISGGTPQRTR